MIEFSCSGNVGTYNSDQTLDGANFRTNNSDGTLDWTNFD
jgi:hypothetical protein